MASKIDEWCLNGKLAHSPEIFPFITDALFPGVELTLPGVVDGVKVMETMMVCQKIN